PFLESEIKLFECGLRGGWVVELFNDSGREMLFGLHRMNCRQSLAEKNLVVPGHQNIRDTHQLSEHLSWRLADPDVVIQTLTHFLDAIEPFQNRLNTGDLLCLALFFLEAAADHDIEKLVRSAELDIGVDHD